MRAHAALCGSESVQQRHHAKRAKRHHRADHASPRYMRAFDFHTGEEKKKALESLLDL